MSLTASNVTFSIFVRLRAANNTSIKQRVKAESLEIEDLDQVQLAEKDSQITTLKRTIDWINDPDI